MMNDNIRKVIEEHEGEIVAIIQLAIVGAAAANLLKPDKTAKKLRKQEYKNLSKRKKLDTKLKIKETKASAKAKAKLVKIKDKNRVKALKQKGKLDAAKKKEEIQRHKASVVSKVVEKVTG